MQAIVLGSGLGGFSEYFEVVKIEPFEDVVNFRIDNLDGHDRRFIWCRYKRQEFLVISGKLHFYEGHTFSELIGPIRYAIEQFGVKEIVVTSASGGLRNEIINGQWTLINQVVSIPVVNLDAPKSNDSMTPFPISQSIESAFGELPKAIYAYHQGPSLGTNAEYKMLHSLGAGLVGMSMYPEYYYLKSLNIKSHFLSLPVCNYFPFESLVEPSFEEVLEISSSSIPKLVDIFKKYLSPSKT